MFYNVNNHFGNLNNTDADEASMPSEVEDMNDNKLENISQDNNQPGKEEAQEQNPEPMEVDIREFKTTTEFSKTSNTDQFIRKRRGETVI